MLDPGGGNNIQAFREDSKRHQCLIEEKKKINIHVFRADSKWFDQIQFELKIDQANIE